MHHRDLFAVHTRSDRKDSWPPTHMDCSGRTGSSRAEKDILAEYHRASPRCRERCTCRDTASQQGYSAEQCHTDCWDRTFPVVQGGWWAEHPLARVSQVAQVNRVVRANQAVRERPMVHQSLACLEHRSAWAADLACKGSTAG